MHTPSTVILIVDDEPTVLTVLQLGLQRFGFTIHLAWSGKEAVEVYRREQQALSLVLLDVQMPDMDGPQTLLELQKINPDVVCCFMSGGLGQYSAPQLLEMGATAVLSKPFTNLENLATILFHFAKPR